jgi:hypothetical protein
VEPVESTVTVSELKPLTLFGLRWLFDHPDQSLVPQDHPQSTCFSGQTRKLWLTLGQAVKQVVGSHGQHTVCSQSEMHFSTNGQMSGICRRSANTHLDFLFFLVPSVSEGVAILLCDGDVLRTVAGTMFRVRDGLVLL